MLNLTMGKKIAAVVVTHNRRDLLMRTIDCLRNQTLDLDSIIIINNESTDGTKEWLDLQLGLEVIHQANVGGSGGFYTGISYAFEKGFDWIWCMDDDVFPENNCLEILLAHNDDQIGILCPRRIQGGQNCLTEVRKLNLSNPLKKLHGKLVEEKDLARDKIFLEGMTFEGPLIKREVVAEIGLPNRDLFLFYDDTDYSYRTVMSGFQIAYVPAAILQKERFYVDLSREEEVIKLKWKLPYGMRNAVYFCHKYGKNTLFRYFGAFLLYLYMFMAICKNFFLNKKYQFSDITMLFKCYRDGINSHLGKIG